MIKFLLLTLLFGGTSAHAGTRLHVVDSVKAAQTSYLSSEYNEPIPWWVINGEVLTAGQARSRIRSGGATACAGWLMNFSSDRSVDKNTIQNSLLRPDHELSLWKTVSGMPVFGDPETSYMLSFVCLALNERGQIDEVTPPDLAQIWKGIFVLDKVEEKVRLRQ